MENNETSNKPEIVAERSLNRASSEQNVSDYRQGNMEIADGSVPNDINRELNAAELREAVENSHQRAKRARDARKVKILVHNGQPCPGKNCTLCIDKADYKDGGLEMSELTAEKFTKYFASEDQNAYIHPDFYPGIKFQPTHEHCKEICCVCSRFPYLHGASQEFDSHAYLKNDEPLSEICIKCKAVSILQSVSLPQRFGTRTYIYFIGCSYDVCGSL